MKYQAYLYRASDEELARAKLWLEITKLEWEIYNIPQWKPEDVLFNTVNIVCFGTVINNLLEQVLLEKDILPVSFTVLPLMSELVDLISNKDKRMAALTTLQTLPDKIKQLRLSNIPKSFILKYDQIKDISKGLLTKLLQQSIHNSILIDLDKNLTLEIFFKEINNSGADLSITLPELLLLHELKDTLNIKEIKIERKNNDC